MSGRKLFGTDGVRGKANIYPMTGEMAFVLGRAVTSYFQKNFSRRPLIIIGKDTRLSCYMLEQAFSSGVCSQGGKAILTGPLPTPGVAFVTQSMRADAGVMISASHNPMPDNGIKLFARGGGKLDDAIEDAIEAHLKITNNLPIGSGVGRIRSDHDLIEKYLSEI
jgi:phosphoglucosamine mutase